MPETLPLYRSPPLAAVEKVDGADLDTSCTRCELHERAKAVCVGPDARKYTGAGGLLLVGESPGGQEDSYNDGTRKGFPFIGPSGHKLRGVVDQYWKGSVVYDNAIRCMPGRKSDDKRLMTKAADQCRGYLAQMLRDVKPSRIVTLGAWASYSVLGRALPPFSVRRGYGWVYNEGEPIPVFMVIHPAAALRNRFVDGWFKSDLRWALTCDKPKQPPWDATVRVVLTPEDAAQAIAELRAARWLSFDTETFGRMFTPEFRLLCLAASANDSNEAWVWGREALAQPGCIRPLRDLMADKTAKKVATNEKFDAQAVSLALAVTLMGFHGDPQLWRKLLDPDALARLEYQAELVGMGGHKEENKKYVVAGRAAMKKWSKAAGKGDFDLTVDDVLATPKKGQPAVQLTHLAQPDWFTDDIRNLVKILDADDLDVWAYGLVPRNVLYTYCARDTITAGKSADLLEGQLVENAPASKVWRRMVRPLSRAVQQIETWGIGASPTAIHAFGGYLQLKLGTVRERLSAYGADFNPDSPPQVRELLFKKLGLVSTAQTDSGLESTDKDTLETLKGQHPVVDDIVMWRKYSKLQSTYALGMEPHVRPDGRIHCTYKIDGTRTGRPSAENPNMLNIPRSNTPDGKMARDCFIAPPGRILVEGDYSQQELRVACMLSGDREMLKLFQSGADFHMETARFIAPMVWKTKPEDVTEEQRSRTKTFVFGIIYGMSDEGIVARTGCSMREAQLIRQAVMGRFADLSRWIQERERETLRTGEAWTWWEGERFRCRPLYRIGDADGVGRMEAQHSSYNTPVQGTAAEYCNAAVVELVDWIVRSGRNEKLVLTVYDSILMEVDEDKTDEVRAQMKGTMLSYSCGNVPLAVDFKQGRSWGSLEKIKVAA